MRVDKHMKYVNDKHVEKQMKRPRVLDLERRHGQLNPEVPREQEKNLTIPNELDVESSPVKLVKEVTWTQTSNWWSQRRREAREQPAHRARGPRRAVLRLQRHSRPTRRCRLVGLTRVR